MQQYQQLMSNYNTKENIILAIEKPLADINTLNWYGHEMDNSFYLMDDISDFINYLEGLNANFIGFKKLPSNLTKTTGSILCNYALTMENRDTNDIYWTHIDAEFIHSIIRKLELPEVTEAKLIAMYEVPPDVIPEEDDIFVRTICYKR